MIYNFEIHLNDLNGTPITQDGKVLTLGVLLAPQLVNQPKGNALKFFSWAKKMNAGQDINLDKADVRTLRDFIQDSETITILGKAQVFEYIDGIQNND